MNIETYLKWHWLWSISSIIIGIINFLILHVVMVYGVVFDGNHTPSNVIGILDKVTTIIDSDNRTAHDSTIPGNSCRLHLQSETDKGWFAKTLYGTRGRSHSDYDQPRQYQNCDAGTLLTDDGNDNCGHLGFDSYNGTVLEPKPIATDRSMKVVPILSIDREVDRMFRATDTGGTMSLNMLAPPPSFSSPSSIISLANSHDDDNDILSDFVDLVKSSERNNEMVAGTPTGDADLNTYKKRRSFSPIFYPGENSGIISQIGNKGGALIAYSTNNSFACTSGREGTLVSIENSPRPFKKTRKYGDCISNAFTIYRNGIFIRQILFYLFCFIKT